MPSPTGEVRTNGWLFHAFMLYEAPEERGGLTVCLCAGATRDSGMTADQVIAKWSPRKLVAISTRRETWKHGRTRQEVSRDLHEWRKRNNREGFTTTYQIAQEDVP